MLWLQTDLPGDTDPTGETKTFETVTECGQQEEVIGKQIR